MILSANNSHIEFELRIKSSTSNLSRVRSFVEETAAGLGVKSEIINQVILAVDEACTNIIRHAYNYSPDGEILIKIFFEPDKFTVKIIDTGDSFKPESVPEPDLRKFQKERKKGGLGMFLMKKLMDEVNYVSVANGNQVILVKYLN